ncbi:MAG TPA: sigma factor-like helix-turn-helix DNA-binding protein [Patescibacteria group bacterium]|nr:sigma factor-like helix-turn-helix DNA-binding protein [Patescibacteria group bacterium]
MRSNQTQRYFRNFIKKIPNLSGKEKDVLLKRLRRETLENIGKPFKLTEGRIRQIEHTALVKLKSKKRQLALFRKLFSSSK